VILYYALGGGLGHLVRAHRLLDALGCSDRAALLTASEFADDPRVVGELPVIRVPGRLGHDRSAFRAWLADALRGLRPDRLIVDSFPGGILGELCGMTLPPAHHVARLLRWPAYAGRLGDGPLPQFEVTYVLEPLAQRHQRALEACSRELRSLSVQVPSTDTGRPLAAGPHWLVVHSGPDAEVAQLADYASERARARVVVVAPRRPPSLPPGAQWVDVHPVAPHLAHAQTIVTAAGFNLMHETSALLDRHHFIPFPRPLDDQYARARRATLEHDRPAIVRDHPVVEMAAQRPREHDPLEVAADPDEIVDRVAVTNARDVLVDDRPGV
jgi:hypothetical protein